MRAEASRSSCKRIIMKEETDSLVENAFAASCVSAGFRLDGRRRTSARRAHINLGPSWGEAEVTLDRTRAIASATVEAITPTTDRPNEGVVQISVELSTASSEPAAREIAGLRGGPASSAATAELRTIVERVLRESRAIDTEALCILSGVKVWVVRVAVDVLDDDGNAVDAAALAAGAALLHARHPDVTVSGRDVVVHSLDEREPVPLPIHHVPVSTTFALFSSPDPAAADAVVLDPTRREEFASAGSLTLAFNVQGEVCGMYKAGGMPIDPVLLAECANLAAARAVEVTKLLGDAMKDAASQHPMATVRPVLSNPEPVAVLDPTTLGGSDTANKSASRGIGGAWNATPVPDKAPPRTDVKRMEDSNSSGDFARTGYNGKQKKNRSSARKKDLTT